MGGEGFISSGINSIKQNRAYMRGNQMFKKVNDLKMPSAENYQNETEPLNEKELASIRNRIHLKYRRGRIRNQVLAITITCLMLLFFYALTQFNYPLNYIQFFD